MTFDPERVLFGFHADTRRVFVDSPSPDDEVTCECCNVAMPYSDWTTHKATSKHQRYFKREVDLVNTETELWRRRQEAIGLSRRIASLSLKEHQNVVNLKLLEYLTNTKVPLHTVEDELEQYEYMDRKVLLKLIIWKTACITHQPGGGGGGTATSGIRDAVEWCHWMTKGWKDFKEEYRPSNRFAILCQHVLPYLRPNHSNIAEVVPSRPATTTTRTTTTVHTPILPFHDPRSIEHFVANIDDRPGKCSRCHIEVLSQHWGLHLKTLRHKLLDEKAVKVNRFETKLWKRRCQAEQVWVRRIATLTVEEHRNEAKLHLLRYISNLGELESTLEIRLDKYEALESTALLEQLEGCGGDWEMSS